MQKSKGSQDRALGAMVGKFSLRRGFLPSQASREGFLEEVTPKWILKGCGVRKMKGVREVGIVFGAEEMAFAKVGHKREWGTLEVPASPECGQDLDEGEEGEAEP